jgi:hypothetical protein
VDRAAAALRACVTLCLVLGPARAVSGRFRNCSRRAQGTLEAAPSTSTGGRAGGGELPPPNPKQHGTTDLQRGEPLVVNLDSPPTHA